MKAYMTVALAATIFAWRGATNHTTDEIAQIKAAADEHGIAVRVEGEGLVLRGDNGTWGASDGQYIVIKADGLYEVVDYLTLVAKYQPAEGIEPFPEPEGADPIPEVTGDEPGFTAG